ncbi:DUF2852 domain-containing protein [Oceanibacterium hippocampi]|uniref:DUF2852 domain-containing protein n=1 Tax=Oceanibacterium hippocampi TaxID=745714 RepID=A0A1Y5U397_9PROT|nr:DUF2852 domain-containing protein [Oceanibacterium hippocampi]SLN75792.1 hypothetical protein OCH7691_03963 [Oceanibacterium hippocampi]
MDVTAKLDDMGKPAWIAVMVLGFIVFWPVGLAILGYLIWSGRMGCWKRNGMNGMGRARGRWHGPQNGRHAESTGNSAFDEYRNETLQRLEEEQKEFFAFLERLRQAKDKAEFDQFMADRRQGGGSQSGPEPQPQA